MTGFPAVQEGAISLTPGRGPEVPGNHLSEKKRYVISYLVVVEK